jgi:hypothetical protein
VARKYHMNKQTISRWMMAPKQPFLGPVPFNIVSRKTVGKAATATPQRFEYFSHIKYNLRKFKKVFENVQCHYFVFDVFIHRFC